MCDTPYYSTAYSIHHLIQAIPFDTGYPISIEDIPYSNLVQFVFFAQVDRLSPAVVILVEVGGDATELEEFVFLQKLGQSDSVKVIKRINGFS